MVARLFALTLDQRNSRTNSDIVAEFMKTTNRLYSRGLERKFERTSGDEVQGLVRDPESAIDIVLNALSAKEWWIGLGIGPVGAPIPKSVRESSGPALQNARTAIDRAKKRSNSHRFWIVADDPREADLATVLSLIAVIIDRQSAPTLEAERLFRKGLKQEDAARTLGITQQAYAQRLRRGSVQEKELGRLLAIRIAQAIATS